MNGEGQVVVVDVIDRCQLAHDLGRQVAEPVDGDLEAAALRPVDRHKLTKLQHDLRREVAEPVDGDLEAAALRPVDRHNDANTHKLRQSATYTV